MRDAEASCSLQAPEAACDGGGMTHRAGRWVPRWWRRAQPARRQWPTPRSPSVLWREPIDLRYYAALAWA